MCGYIEEINWHLFVDCPYATECLERARLRQTVEVAVWNGEGFCELIFHIIATQLKSVATSFVMVLWQVWKEHNERVWNDSCNTPSQVVLFSVVYLKEWTVGAQQTEVAARLLVNGPNGEHVSGGLRRAWHRPDVGSLKLNVDAAFFENTNQTGIGMVIRDELETFILVKTIVVPGNLQVDVGEAMSFYEALSWVKALALDNVVIEGDSKVTVDAIGSSSLGCSVFGDYVKACKAILRYSPSYSVGFVRRDANLLAHEFARVSRDFGNPHCWLDPPTFVDGLTDPPCVCNNEN